MNGPLSVGDESESRNVLENMSVDRISTKIWRLRAFTGSHNTKSDL